MTGKRCSQRECVAIYALQAMPARAASQMAAHLPTCNECQEELEKVRPVVNCLIDWPSDDIKSTAATRESLARRISCEIDREITLPVARATWEPEWEQVSPGIWCRLLATDTARDRVSMLVRLAPDVIYPSHTHAGVEELHLLDGELWIDERKLFAGDYHRAEPGSSDRQVWSETGCTCVLITSPSDVLG